MKSTQTLPDNYHPVTRIDLKHERHVLLSISIASILIIPVAGWFFFQILFWLRPNVVSHVFNFQFDNIWALLIFLLCIALAYIFMITLHEAIHGFFFWLFTRHMPIFGFRVYYAYAAAPSWYLPRNQYLITGLAPLLIISLLGIMFMIFVPPSYLMLLMFILLSNASGAAGDLYVAVRLLQHPASCLANDQGDVFSLYLPKKHLVNNLS